MPLESNLTEQEIAQLQLAKQKALAAKNAIELLMSSIDELGTSRIDGLDLDVIASKFGYPGKPKSEIVNLQRTSIQARKDSVQLALAEFAAEIKKLGVNIT
jgi:hypothetical protein